VNRDTLFSRGITMANVVLILLGIWLCYLAFSFVRVVAFWILFHVFGIAASLAAIAVVFFWWKAKRK